MKTIKILGGDSYEDAIRMFLKKGFNVIPEYSTEPFDTLVFLGGTDVCPSVYGDKRHPETDYPDKARDEKEVGYYQKYKAPSVLKIGICRGGQLLNVLNGGGMIQHIDPRISGKVHAYDVDFLEDEVELLVDHHQGMVSGEGSEVFTWYCSDTGLNSYINLLDYSFYYPETNSFCFQPHPEWGHRGTHDLFFKHLDLIISRKD